MNTVTKNRLTMIVVPIVLGAALALGAHAPAYADDGPSITPNPAYNADDPNAPCAFVDGVLVQVQVSGYVPCPPNPGLPVSPAPIAYTHPHRAPAVVPAVVFVAPVIPDGDAALTARELAAGVIA